MRHKLARLAALAAGATLILAPSAPRAADAVSPVTRHHRPIVAFGANQSSNWSGYNQGALEKGTQFHSVAGDWRVPTASQHKKGEARTRPPGSGSAAAASTPTVSPPMPRSSRPAPSPTSMRPARPATPHGGS